MPDAKLTDAEREALEQVAGTGDSAVVFPLRHPDEVPNLLADLVRRALAAVPRLASSAAPAGEREADSGFVVLNPRGDVDFRAKLRMTPDGAWGDIGSRWGSRSNATKASMIEEFEAEGYRVVPARLLIESPSPGAARDEGR